MIFRARYPEEISAKYKGLEVMVDRPDWMTPEKYHSIRDRLYYDIDEEPTGFLKEIIDSGEIKPIG